MNNEWQPIETAPQDGTWILAVIAADEYTEAYQMVVQWDDSFSWTDGEFLNRDAIYWMPLPEMPKGI